MCLQCGACPHFDFAVVQEVCDGHHLTESQGSATMTVGQSLLVRPLARHWISSSELCCKPYVLLASVATAS